MKTRMIYAIPILMGAVNVGSAQEDLGQINVTASRVEAPSVTSSRPVTVIDRKAIVQSHAANVVDVLKGQANIVVRDTSGTGAKSIVDLGGYGDSAASNKVVLIDGRRISNPDLAEVDWTQIPLDQIERIEIVHGGGSVLYGDGAVGGVINIITRIPESGGEIAIGAGSFGSMNARGRLGADAGKVRVSANFSGSKTNGYRDNSKLENYDAGAVFEADISRHVQWYGGGNHHRDRFGLPGSLTQAQVNANRRQTLKADEYGSTMDSFINSGLLLNWRTLELDLPASIRRRESLAHYGGAFPFDSTSVLRTKSFRPKLNWQPSVAGISIAMIAGADIDRVGGSVAGLITNRDRSGYYAKINATDSSDRYALTAGIRSEKVADALKDGTSSISNRLNAYDIGAAVGFGAFRLRLDHNSSIRFPRLDERTEYLPPLYAPSFRRDLLPQTGRHYNASLRYEHQSGWLEASYQRADLKHELYLDPTIGFFGTNSNYTSPTRHEVLMLAGYWKVHQLLQFSANFTRTRATFQGGTFDGKTIPGVPRNRFGAQWSADWTSTLTTNVAATYVGNSYLLNDQLNALAPLGAYWLIDAAASCRWNGFEVFVRIDNLANRKYITTGAVSPSSGAIGLYPAATIAMHGGVSYKF